MMHGVPPALADLLGPDHVLAGEAAADFAVDGCRPALAAFPGTPEEVAAVLALAEREGLAVVPWGGGTGQGLGNPPERYDLALSLARLDRVLDYQPADLTVTVEAGIPLGRLQERLAEHGQFLPLDPPHGDRATVGGILARAATGPRRLRYGAPRDLLIGIRVAHPDGTLSRAGGKVVKNVAGYDLNKLYTGSLGTLGVIMAATFKVLPRPARVGTAVAIFPSLEAACRAARSFLDVPARPLALDVLNPPALRRLADQAGLEVRTPEGYAVVAEFGGVPAAVERQLLDFSDHMDEGGWDLRQVSVDVAPADRLHQALADLGWDVPDPAGFALRASVVPTAIPDVVQAWEEQGRQVGRRPLVRAHSGVGVVQSFWGIIGSEPPSFAAGLVARLREAVAGLGGSLLVAACPPEVKALVDVWGPVPESFPLMQRIKAEFDPRRTLNPGRFLGRL
ncbi:MAG: FAD-binding oxidoreductase [Chloroflexi bacterium]|nr:FAD-binding oxidoreductase [Chloroflexota bacterium]